MLENFDNLNFGEDMAAGMLSHTDLGSTPAPSIGGFEKLPKKLRKQLKNLPKSKKKQRKLLKQLQRERDEIIFRNGCLATENQMLKMLILMSIHAKKGSLDDRIAANGLKMLPPGRS